MPKIKLKSDNLNELNGNFEHRRLKQPLFLNSIPKSGSHLLRNIMRMFVPLEQHYQNKFIQVPSMKEDRIAWDINRPTLSWGHLLNSDEALVYLKDARIILLIRDPYDWVLARARFFVSDEFQGSLDHLKSDAVSMEELLNMMIFGIHMKVPMMSEIFTHNGASWMGARAHVMKFEDLVHHVKNLETDEAEVFFRDLMEKAGLDGFPSDWRERVRVGSDKKQSGTARENLTNTQKEFPKELPEIQKRMVDYAVPGLRRLMGYE